MSEATTTERFSGVGRPIAAFVRSRVAGHLLMVLALGGGLLAALNLPVKELPDFDPRQVVVTVPYPGLESGGSRREHNPADRRAGDRP